MATAEQRGVDMDCQRGRADLRASSDEQDALERTTATVHTQLRVRSALCLHALAACKLYKQPGAKVEPGP